MSSLFGILSKPLDPKAREGRRIAYKDNGKNKVKYHIIDNKHFQNRLANSLVQRHHSISFVLSLTFMSMPIPMP